MMARKMVARPTVTEIRRRVERQHQWAVQQAAQYEPLTEMRGWHEGRADAFTEVLAWIDGADG